MRGCWKKIAFILMLVIYSTGGAAINIEDIRQEINVQKSKYTPYQDILQSILNGKKNQIAYIKAQLKLAGLPENYYLIPMIESRYNSTAVSPAGAVGMWQIMKPTALRFGLRIDDEIDERLFFGPSTEAAIQYLSILFRLFNQNEYLALAAYNAGEGRLKSALSIPQAKAHRFSSIKLPTETKNYIYRYYALVDLLTETDQFNLVPVAPIKKNRLESFDSLFHHRQVIRMKAIRPFI